MQLWLNVLLWQGCHVQIGLLLLIVGATVPGTPYNVKREGDRRGFPEYLRSHSAACAGKVTRAVRLTEMPGQHCDRLFFFLFYQLKAAQTQF